MSLLKSVSSGVQVPSASSPSSTTGGSDFDDFTVPTPSNGDTLITATFEGLAVGEKAVGDTAFLALSDGTTNNRSYIDNAQAYLSSQSCRVDYREGTNGVRTGGYWLLPDGGIGFNQELWVRVRMKTQPDFNWLCSNCTSGIKFIRFEVYNESGFVRSWDLYMGRWGVFIDTDDSGVGSDFHAAYTDWPLTGELTKNIGSAPVNDVWEAYEFNVKIHTDPLQSYIKTWQNRNLLFNSEGVNDHATADDSTQYIRFAKLFTYWNNGVPQDQSLWIDDIIITDNNPGDTDNDGNPFIGT